MERRFRYCPAMLREILIRPAASAEAELLLGVMCRAFAKYRGVLRPESSVFVETEAMIAEKLRGGGGFLAVENDRPVGCIIAELKGDRGYPMGYLGRLAVDPAFHPMGELLWIDADAPLLRGAFPTYRGMVAALDTGGAIKGEVRADLYLGQGAEAGAAAGRVRHTLHLWRLVPR